LPLLSSSGDEVKGIMFLDSRERIAAFTTKDLEVLSAIAAQGVGGPGEQRVRPGAGARGDPAGAAARFLSPALVEQAARGSIELSKGGALTEGPSSSATSGGSPASRRSCPPRKWCGCSNDYFELMVDILFEHNGILDKFIGDAIMGLWGAPVKRADDATNAVRAAVKMQKRSPSGTRSGSRRTRCRSGSASACTRAGGGGEHGLVEGAQLHRHRRRREPGLAALRVAREDMVVISEECALRAGKDKFMLEALPPRR